MNFWRTASSSADTSGYSYFQTQFLSASTNLISPTGTLEVEKYVRSSPADVIYKKVANLVLHSGDITNRSKDGITFITNDYPTSHAGFIRLQKSNGIYVASFADYLSPTVYDIKTTTDFSSWTIKKNGAFTIFTSPTLWVTFDSSSFEIFYYSTDNGETWTTSSYVATGDAVQGMLLIEGKVVLLKKIYDSGIEQTLLNFEVLATPNATSGTLYRLTDIYNPEFNFIQSQEDDAGRIFMIVEDADLNNYLIRIDSLPTSDLSGIDIAFLGNNVDNLLYVCSKTGHYFSNIYPFDMSTIYTDGFNISDPYGEGWAYTEIVALPWYYDGKKFIKTYNSDLAETKVWSSPYAVTTWTEVADFPEITFFYSLNK